MMHKPNWPARHLCNATNKPLITDPLISLINANDLLISVNNPLITASNEYS